MANSSAKLQWSSLQCKGFGFFFKAIFQLGFLLDKHGDRGQLFYHSHILSYHTFHILNGNRSMLNAIIIMCTVTFMELYVSKCRAMPSLQTSSETRHLSLCLYLLSLQTSKLPFALFLFSLKNTIPLGQIQLNMAAMAT